MAQAKLNPKQSLFVGVTLFSMFFGAGNLILPPLLGLQAGASTIPAMAGFLVTGIGLPVMGIVAVGLAGSIDKLANRVHPFFTVFFAAAVYLSIGPCLAIPRTSSTAFEMMEPLLPEGIALEVPRLIFSIVFFIIAYLLAMHPNALTKLLGRITGPALICLIVAVVGAALLNPVDVVPAAQSTYENVPAMQGFLTGYQTMDLLASLTFGIVIAANIRDLGVTEESGLVREVSRAGVFAGVLMGVIYCGLAFVGTTLAASMPEATNGAEILSASAASHFGAAGTLVVAAIFFLACLNVCIGLISCCGAYFAKEFPRFSYRTWALVFAFFSCFVSNFGLDTILKFSVPLLNALYPMAIVLVTMGVFHRHLDKFPAAWPYSMVLTGVVSIVTALRDAFFAGVWLPFDALPFAEYGMNWLLPALVGFTVGLIASRYTSHKTSSAV